MYLLAYIPVRGQQSDLPGDWLRGWGVRGGGVRDRQRQAEESSNGGRERKQPRDVLGKKLYRDYGTEIILSSLKGNYLILLQILLQWVLVQCFSFTDSDILRCVTDISGLTMDHDMCL